MKSLKLAACLAVILSGNLFGGTVTFTALLNGANEMPPNASTATGTATVIFDTSLHTMQVMVDFIGLIGGGNTAAHLHCCTAVAGTGTAGPATATPTFPGFPTGATSGTYNQTFDLTLASSYRSGFITSSGGTTALAESTLLAGALAGQAYVNIHTPTYPGGEIRGFLATPEPGTFGAGAAALVLLGFVRRRMLL